MNIRTVNMVWERKIRGAYPVARYALDAGGTLTLAIPRPLEARAYDLTRLALDGGAEVRLGFSVETLVKLEVTAQADDFLGITADDLYLFHAGGKGRFLAERHISYVDASISADGQHLAAGFSDMAGASYALAYGEIGGRMAWLREIDATLTAVALSRDGQRMVVGAENGLLRLIDAGRRDVWTFEQPSPIRALACSTDGLKIVYGGADGTVGLIDGEGARRWETRLEGEVVALALSADGDLCAALCRTGDEAGLTQIYCLVGAGQVGWEYAAEKRLIGLALSPDGRHLATGARDGTVAVYAVVPGEGATGAGGAVSDPLAGADARAQAGDLEGACRLLQEALQAHPTDVALCERWMERRQAWLEQRAAEARAHLDAGDPGAAVAVLEGVAAAEPPHPESLALLNQAREAYGRQLLEAARAHSAAGREEEAEATLRRALAQAPLLLEARRELAGLSARGAADADAEADRLLAQGNLEAGVAALERAQAVAPSAERAAKLNLAHTAMEFAEGMTAYNEKRYNEAVFQFKKVLARDPDHAEAKRYLGFAQKFAQDATTDSLGDRFSRLE